SISEKSPESASGTAPVRPVVPRLSLRRVFNQKERAGDYTLKMDYQCDTPEISESELECTDDVEDLPGIEISTIHLDEAIEAMLVRRRRHVASQAERRRASNSWWHRLFGGCFLEEDQGTPRGLTMSMVETLPVSMMTQGLASGRHLPKLEPCVHASDAAAGKQRPEVRT
ncbi:unnamed protein product, partial [Symbiodinium pilosum]